MTSRSLIYLSLIPILMLIVSGGLVFTVGAFEKSEETIAQNMQSFSSTAGEFEKSAQPVETIRQLTSKLTAICRAYLDAATARNRLLISIATIIGLGAAFEMLLLVLVYRRCKSPNPAFERDCAKARSPSI